MAHIKAVVFDLYGTLIHNSIKTQPYLRLFSELGLLENESRDAYYFALTGSFGSLEEFVGKIRPGSKIDVGKYEEGIRQETESASLYPEATKVLDELKARDFKLGLISNLSTPYKRPVFDLGLDAYFDKMIFSCDVKSRKPEREIYERMLNELSMEPQFVMMTGDNARDDVEGPKSAGIDAVHLDRNNGSPGSIATLEGIFLYL